MTTPDSAQNDRTRETVAGIAYHIDKTCTGGTDEDFTAAEAIRDEFVAPLEAERDRYREAIEQARNLVAEAYRDDELDDSPGNLAFAVLCAALDQEQS